MNFQQQNGILRSNQYQNAGVLVKLEYRPTEKLIFALNLSANTRKNEDHASAVNPFTYAVFANPYEKPYNEDGSYASDLSYLPNNYTTETASGYLYDRFNILRELTETRTTQTGLDAEFTFNVRYEVIPGLNLQSIIRKGISYNTEMKAVNAGTYTSWANEKLGRDIFKEGPLPNQYDNGELSENSGRNHNWSLRNQIDYSIALKENHLFSILLANEVISKNSIISAIPPPSIMRIIALRDYLHSIPGSITKPCETAWEACSILRTDRTAAFPFWVHSVTATKTVT